MTAAAFKNLLEASLAWDTAGSSRGPNAQRGTIRGLPIAGYDATGHSDARSRYGVWVNDSIVALCFSDYDQNLSMSVIYDGNPRNNGNNALLGFYSVSNCPTPVGNVANLYLDRAADGRSIDYTAAVGPHLATASKRMTATDQRLADLVRSTRFGSTVVAAHWISSFM